MELLTLSNNIIYSKIIKLSINYNEYEKNEKNYKQSFKLDFNNQKNTIK